MDYNIEGGIASSAYVDLSPEEKIDVFVKKLKIDMSSSKLNADLLTIDTLSDKTINFQYNRCQIGRLKITKRSSGIQVLDRVNVEWYKDEPLEFYLSKIPEWIKYAQEIDDFKKKQTANYGFSEGEIKTQHDKLLQKNKGFSRNDAIWALFNNKQLWLATKGMWNEYAACQFDMAMFLRNERKDKHALPHICTSIYVNLIGLDGFNHYDAKKRIDELSNLLEKCNMSIEDFFNYFQNEAARYFPEITGDPFTVQLKCFIICDVLHGNDIVDTVNKYRKELSQASSDQETTPKGHTANTDADSSSQSKQWQKQGLCKHCGGKLSGLLVKKCKSCHK